MAVDDSASATSSAADLAKRELLRSAIKKIIDPYMVQQGEGFERVARLLSLARRIHQPTSLSVLGDRSDQEAAQDILRAAVVLIHAHLEEFLRTMARVLLPEGNEACLNEIPLAGLGRRKEKFFLGKLVQHKGKLVDDLLKSSVSEHLERSNYNSTDEIGKLLKSLDFEVSDHDKEFPAIQQMMERRHQIVHRADRFEAANAIASLKPIEPDDVSRWLIATHALMETLGFPLLLKLVALEAKAPGSATASK